MYYYADGDVYQGHWKNSKREGKGVYTWKSGRKYEGEYVQDSRNGLGTMYFPDEFHFECNWQKGKPLDKNVSVHPFAKDRSQRDLCTANGSYHPQYFHTCTTCQRTYCCVCIRNCHLASDHNIEEEWLSEDICGCWNTTDCKCQHPSKRLKMC